MTKNENATFPNLQDVKIGVLCSNLSLQVLIATMRDEEANQQVSRTIRSRESNLNTKLTNGKQ